MYDGCVCLCDVHLCESVALLSLGLPANIKFAGKPRLLRNQTLNKQEILSFKKAETLYQSPRRNIPDDLNRRQSR
jgi:hypothetical protein